MAYDLNRCPQTEGEFAEYFYTLIGQQQGAPAHSWESVLSATYVWKGQWLRIPDGVGPGITQPPDAPFFGLTQQWSGGPKGRVFLPTNTPDDLGYYTRCMQYLDDAPGTYAATAAAGKPSPNFQSVKTGSLVWAWYYVAGTAYAPVTGADGNSPSSGSGGLTEQQRYEVEAMIQSHLANCVQVGDKVALRMANGTVLCAEGGGPEDEKQPVVLTSRDSVGPWESFHVEEGTY